MVEKTQWTAFLAGPMNGAPSWQAQAPKADEWRTILAGSSPQGGCSGGN